MAGGQRGRTAMRRSAYVPVPEPTRYLQVKVLEPGVSVVRRKPAPSREPAVPAIPMLVLSAAGMLLAPLTSKLMREDTEVVLTLEL